MGFIRSLCRLDLQSLADQKSESLISIQGDNSIVVCSLRVPSVFLGSDVSHHVNRKIGNESHVTLDSSPKCKIAAWQRIERPLSAGALRGKSLDDIPTTSLATFPHFCVWRRPVWAIAAGQVLHRLRSKPDSLRMSH